MPKQLNQKTIYDFFTILKNKLTISNWDVRAKQSSFRREFLIAYSQIMQREKNTIYVYIIYTLDQHTLAINFLERHMFIKQGEKNWISIYKRKQRVVQNFIFSFVFLQIKTKWNKLKVNGSVALYVCCFLSFFLFRKENTWKKFRKCFFPSHLTILKGSE